MKSPASIPRETHCQHLSEARTPRLRLLHAALLLFALLPYPWTPPTQAQVPRTCLDAPGVLIVTSDRITFADSEHNQSNWQPRTTVLGNETLALAANGWNLPGDWEGYPERTLVAFFSEDGAVTEEDGFFNDDGTPWYGNQDIGSSDNPPCVAGDKSDKGVKYLLGNDCTPWAYPAQFPTFGTHGFSYWTTSAVVQLIEETQLGPQPLAKLMDPLFGKETSGGQAGNPTLFGGEIRCLSNGNFAVVIEDQTGNTIPVDRASLATIVDAQDGSSTIGEVIIGPFNANQGANPSAGTGIWSNMAAFDGGFAIRPHTGTEDASGYLTIGFWDNEANPQGTWPTIIRTDPNSPLAPANGLTTSISILSGTETRIDSDIRSDFIYMAGRGVDTSGDPDGGVYITKINAKTRTTADEVYVTEGLSVAPQRVTVCSDKYDNVFVCWSDTSNTGNLQIAGRLYDSNLDPLTDAFLLFEHSELGPESPRGFSVKHPSCSMVGSRILVTGAVDVSSLDYFRNDALAVVLSFAELLPPTPTPTSTEPPEPTATMNPRSDINSDNMVDAKDLLILMQDWMKAAGP